MTDSDFKIHRIDGGPSLLKDVTGRAAGGKRAMVMAGGGLASAVFEIGCLRALDDLFGETSTTDFDIFVGVSAGAITATALACGITGDEMFKSLIGASQIIEPISRNNIFRFNWEEVIQKVAGLPRTYAHAMSRFVRSGKDLTLGEAILSLTEIFPTAPLNGAGIEEYIRNIFASAGRPNSFRALEKTLLIPAVNLDTGETRIFGKGDDLDVPISKAVQASAALPGFYRP
ncbi:MAG: patatin-like phospholipase family protein, partial [Myxococcota bacterium]